LTFARATRFGWGTLVVEPRLRLGFPDDGKDLDRFGFDVIEHPRIFNPKPVLRPLQATQPLDTASAQLGGLVPEMTLDSVPHLRTQMRRQATKLGYRARRQDDLVAHSGQILASSPGSLQGRSNTGDRLQSFGMLKLCQLPPLVRQLATVIVEPYLGRCCVPFP
jgi:hypothetical protein